MFGKSFFRQKNGAVIEPRTMNQLMAPLEGLLRANVGGGISVRRAPGGVPIYEASVARAPLIRAKITGGDVDALGVTGTDQPGVGEATLYVWTPPTRTLGTETRTVYNDYPATIPDNTNVWLWLWEGDYWIVTMNCSPEA